MTDINKIVVRRATAADRNFLIQAIIEADKSGTDKSSYCSLLNINEEELAVLLNNIFEYELDGFEFCDNAFCVLEYESLPVGTCASWVENIDGSPSWQNRMLSIRSEASKESLDHMLSLQHLVEGVMPSRTPLSMQIESVYIAPSFRGKNLFNKMVEFHHQEALLLLSSLNSLELMVYDNNIAAINSYIKSGFEIIQQTKSTSPELKNIFPSDGMLLLSKKINN